MSCTYAKVLLKVYNNSPEFTFILMAVFGYFNFFILNKELFWFVHFYQNLFKVINLIEIIIQVGFFFFYFLIFLL